MKNMNEPAGVRLSTPSCCRWDSRFTTSIYCIGIAANVDADTQSLYDAIDNDETKNVFYFERCSLVRHCCSIRNSFVLIAMGIFNVTKRPRSCRGCSRQEEVAFGSRHDNIPSALVVAVGTPEWRTAYDAPW